MRLASNLNASGLDPKLVDALLEPLPGISMDMGARIALANAIHLVFVIAFIAAVLGLVSAFFAPRRELKDRDAENEPVMVSAD
jgi:hypothetical protein